MNKLLSILFIFIVISSIAIAVRSLLTYQTILNNTGIISTSLDIKIYSDLACTIPLVSTQWGVLNPGQSINKVAYLKNIGNVDATLTCIFKAWSPSGADTHFTVSWNRENAVIHANEVLPFQIDLTVKQTISGISSFSFNAFITAVQ